MLVEKIAFFHTPSALDPTVNGNPARITIIFCVEKIDGGATL